MARQSTSSAAKTHEKAQRAIVGKAQEKNSQPRSAGTTQWRFFLSLNHRQVCLAHLIRKAGGLAERADDSYQSFGVQLKKLLLQLCGFTLAFPRKSRHGQAQSFNFCFSYSVGER
jgi:hypothetical protein